MRTPKQIWVFLILFIPGEYIYTRYIPQKITLERALVGIHQVETEEMARKFCDGVKE